MIKTITLHHHTRPLTSVHFNREGDLLFSTAKDGQCVATAPESGQRLGVYDTSTHALWHCDTTYDSKELAIASADQKVYVFDVTTGLLLEQLQVPGPCKHVQFNKKPLGQDMLLAVVDKFTDSEPKIKVFKKSGGKYEEHFVLDDFPGGGKCLEAHWGPFDETIISTHQGGYVMVWDLKSRQPIREFKAHKENVQCVSMSEDRLLMLTVGAWRPVSLCICAVCWWKRQVCAIVGDSHVRENKGQK
eukprot:GHVN01060114.1.p1 GENE.GHVN01060114.1~~GHVN01060114.1.p1  ORF type:complete len:245 (+),score=7.13 GHVN01060114.1:39-773(+)